MDLKVGKMYINNGKKKKIYPSVELNGADIRTSNTPLRVSLKFLPFPTTKSKNNLWL